MSSVSRYINTHYALFHHISIQLAGSSWYVLKGTAENNGQGPFFKNGVPNIEGHEELRWAIQSNYNNPIVTIDGQTIPIDWFYDGTIEWEIIWTKQFNGAENAFQAEGDLISFFINSPNYHWGKDYFNQGRYRGCGGVAGVHCVCVIAIKNFGQLLSDKTVGYSTNIRPSFLQEMMDEQDSSYINLVDLHEDKLDAIQRRRHYQQSRGEARRQRAVMEAGMNGSVEEEDMIDDEEWVFDEYEEIQPAGSRSSTLERPALLVMRDDGNKKKAAKKRKKSPATNAKAKDNRKNPPATKAKDNRKKPPATKAKDNRKKPPATKPTETKSVPASAASKPRRTGRAKTKKIKYTNDDLDSDSDSDSDEIGKKPKPKTDGKKHAVTGSVKTNRRRTLEDSEEEYESGEEG